MDQASKIRKEILIQGHQDEEICLPLPAVNMTHVEKTPPHIDQN